jgi:hypothetical protein
VLSDGDGNPRLVIDSNGRTSIGTDTGGVAFNVINGTYIPLYIEQSTNTDRVASIIKSEYARSTNSATMIQFKSFDDIERGTIKTTGSATSYNTSSDYRLKENIVDMTGAIDRVKQLLPKRFNFIVDTDTTVDGFLAHEAQSVVAEAVTGEKDAVDVDGNIKPQGIDQSKLVPLLTGALKEAIAKIEDLETRIATLEGA